MRLTTLMFAAAALAAPLAIAQLPSGPPAAPPIDAVKAYLSLTDSQLASLATIRQNEMKAIQSIMQDIATKEKALHDTLDKGTTDALAVGKQVLDIDALHKKADQAHTDAQAQAAAVLTAAQKTKLAALDAASKLRQEVQQAVMLDLLAPPQGGGPGGPGGRPNGPGFPAGPPPVN